MAVVGAGIVGTCCALALRAEGLRVALLDRGAPGEGSKGNADHFATEQITPLAIARTLFNRPRMLCQPNGPLVIRCAYLLRLLPWFVRFDGAGGPRRVTAATAALAALNRGTLLAYQWVARWVDLRELIVRTGTLLVCETRRGFAQTCVHAALVAKHGFRAQLLSQTDL